jgi:hypothetical protein
MAREFVHQRKSFYTAPPRRVPSVAAMRKQKIARRAFRQLILSGSTLLNRGDAPDIYAGSKNCQQLRVTADLSARS